MAGEMRFYARLDVRKTMKEIVLSASGIPEEDLGHYFFIISLDDRNIRLPSQPPVPSADRGINYPDIYQLIASQWFGVARSEQDLEAIMDTIATFDMVPIRIEVYPQAEVERAVAGEDIVPEFEAIVRRLEEGREVEPMDVQFDALQYLEELRDAFVDRDRGVAQVRGPGGRFGQVVARATVRPVDSHVQVGRFDVRIAPNGQVRMQNGKLGPKLAGAAEDAIRERSDGHLWMRFKPRGKRARWKRIS